MAFFVVQHTYILLANLLSITLSELGTVLLVHFHPTLKTKHNLDTHGLILSYLWLKPLVL